MHNFKLGNKVYHKADSSPFQDQKPALLKTAVTSSAVLKYKISLIPNKDAEEWFLFKHYAKRKPSVSYCFGLFDENNILQGVCSFGNAIPPFMKRSVCGIEYEHLVYELNRLVVNEGLGKNVLSYFVSKSIKMIPIDCIILSYSDKGMSHNGYIYQACNFMFTGVSDKHIYWCVKGKEHLHERAILDEFKGLPNKVKLLQEKHGVENVYKKERTRKNRYVYFKCNKSLKKILNKAMKKPKLPYPKEENKRYKCDYQIKYKQQKLF